MKNTAKWEMGTKIAKLSLVIAAVYLGMRFIFPIILPFLIALVLARILYPLAKKIENKTGFGRMLSRTAAYFIFLMGIAAVAAVLFYLCYRMGSNCMGSVSKLIVWADDIFGRSCERLEQITGIATEQISRTINGGIGDLTDGAVEYSKDAGWYMLGLFANLFVTFVATLLMLNDYEGITGGLKKTQIGNHVIGVLREIKEASGAYLRAQCMIMGIVSGICIAGLWILQTKHAVWIGIAIGFCDALPFLGTGTVFVPWALVVLILGEYKKAAGYFLIYLICTFTRQILEPRLVGKRLGVPPLAVLMSIYIGIQVYGGVGVILGPVSALIIYEICKCLFIS